MTRRRRLAAVLAAVGVLTLGVTASGGFSSVTAERGVDAAVVPDDEAFLGVDVDGGDGDDRTAISFVGVCTTNDSKVTPSADVVHYKAGADEPTEEALAVAWAADAPVSTVVLKTGGGPSAIETFDVGSATTGTATVGEGTTTGKLTPSDYCPEGEHEAGKLETEAGDLGVAPDATAVGDGVRVTVTNRFSEPLTTVEVTGGGVTRDLADAGETKLGVGESATVTLPADCETVTVVAEGEEVSVRLSRDCP